MRLLAVNYHYIANGSQRMNGIFPVTPSFLRDQITELKKHFRFLSQQELRKIIGSQKNPDGNFCVLTFDDGLKCQYDLALPILKELGVPAIFYVCGKPVTDQELCLVHKIHQLRVNLSDTEFQEKVSHYLEYGLGYNSKDILFDISSKAVLKYRYDSKEIAELKFLLNMHLKEKEKDLLVSSIFDEVFDKKKQLQLWEEIYLSDRQIQELADKGMLGSHTFSHFSLKNLEEAKVKKELQLGKDILEKKFNTQIFSISYPYGSSFDVDEKIAATAQALGFEFGFTMERIMTSNFENPLLLSRLDTNDAFLGKKQVLEVDVNGGVYIKN